MQELLLPFSEGCIEATFIQRVKRFSVETHYEGKSVWAHTNNSGSMLGLLHSGSKAILSPAANPNRKLKWTLEVLEFHNTLVGVNTLTPNRLLKAAHSAGALPQTRAFTEFKAEAKIGDSRLDARLEGPDGTLYVEAKNVTLVEDDIAAFPDAVTERGQKHLKELIRLAAQGVRVAGFYLVQRSDCSCFGPADFIDPDYAKLFYDALEAGVEAWPYLAAVTPNGIGLGEMLPVVPNKA